MWLRPLDLLGAKTLSMFRFFVLTLRLSSSIFMFNDTSVISKNATHPIENIGSKLVFLVVTVGFLTAVTVFQLCLQMEHFLGDPGLVGKGFVTGVLVVSPLLSSWMLALHFGPGLVLDASTSDRSNPRSWLAPRARVFWLITLMLGVLATVSAFAGGFAVAHMFGVDVQRFWVIDERTRALVVFALVRLLVHGTFFPPAVAVCGFFVQENNEQSEFIAVSQVFWASSAVLLIFDSCLWVCFWVLGYV